MFRLSQSSNCDQHKQKLLATILGNRWPHGCSTFQVGYDYKAPIDGQKFEVLNTHCECPAGKYLAAVPLMLCCFLQHGEICIMTTCTDKPQPFQKPAAVLSGI